MKVNKKGLRMIQEITLHEGREKSLLRKHPWVFSKAIFNIAKCINSGDLVKVVSEQGTFLAYGVYNANSQISIRLLSFNEQDIVNNNFIKARIKRAIFLRENFIKRGNDGVRLINSEGDYLPGLIVDKFNDVLVISISSLCMEKYKDVILNTLKEHYKDCSIYERSDTKSRKKEGLSESCGLLYGKDIPDTIYVKENELIKIPIDVKNGHKTGGYLDQRASRHYLLNISKGKEVLNCFSYTGGFSLWALKGGAKKIFNIDVSEHALDLAKKGVVENHLDPGRCKFIKEDVFKFLRDRVADGTKYDIVILDPPKFAENLANLKKACRGYQDINRLGLMLVKKGGYLLTFSCSGLMDLGLFQKIVSDAALDANVEANIINTLRQDEDHVIATSCPETFYLKGLVLRVA